MKQRIVSPEKTAEDIALTPLLRPTSFETFIGNERVVKPLLVSLEAAKQRKEPLGHILLYGPPGCGKTTLARLIGQEKRLFERAAPNLEKPPEVRELLRKVREGDFIFLDEIHSLKRRCEEVLYVAMEDFQISYLDFSQRVEKFTLIGATTKFGKLSPPFRDRFDLILRLDLYKEEELLQILETSRRKLSLDYHRRGLVETAKRSRGTPRIANRFLKRLRDYGGLHNWRQAFNELGVDQFGLDDVDRQYLALLWKRFDGGPVGLDTLSAAFNEATETVSEVIEPYLLRQGFIIRTPRGRVLTSLGFQALNIKENQ